MTRTSRRWLVPLALALLVAFAGCSGAGDAASQEKSGGAPADASLEQTAAAGDDAGYQKSQNEPVRQRALIRTGTVAVEVEDYDAARRNLTRTTRELGGFVSDSGQQVHTRGNQTWTTGRIVLRVPKENFSTLLARAKQTGEVREASTGTKDVTDQLVDLEARLKNLRAQRDRLRELYREANETEDVLEVQKRLSEVQTEIERLEARRKALERKVAYSTLTVRLDESPPDSNPTNPDNWYETGLLAAFVASAHGVVVVLRGLAVTLAYALPYVVVFGVPLGGGYALWRRRKRTKSEPNPEPDVPEENAPDAGDEPEPEDEAE